MINTSAAYKSALANDHRRWKELITITLTDNTVLNLTEADIWAGGLTIKDALCDEEGFNVIGAAVVNEAKLTINNIDGTYDGYDFLWASVQIRVGITLPNETVETFVRGTYTVVEQPEFANASLIELTLYDNMYKLDKAYTTALTYPQTVANIVAEICTNCSVTNSTPTFTNSTVSVTQKPDITDYTYREVLAYMCQISGTYARFKPNGELAISTIDSTNLAKAVANTSGTYHKLNQIYDCTASFDDVVITGVKVLLYEDTGSDLVERTYTSGTTDYCIIVEHNPFVKASEGQAFATRLGNLLTGLQFRKIEVKHGSDPSIEAGDVAQVIDGRGNKYGILITSTEFNTGDSQNTLCSAETPERNSSQKYSQTTRNYVELRKQAIQNKSQTDLLIQGLDNRINSLGGMYYDEVPAPGGGTYYILHNKPDIDDSPVQLRITDEAVAITNNALDPTPTWYGLTVDGNFIANILAAYQSVIVGLGNGSHTKIDQDYSTFYGSNGNVVGRIANGASSTPTVMRTLLYAESSDIAVNYTETVTLEGLPTNDAAFPLRLSVTTNGTTTSTDSTLASTQSGNVSITNSNVTVKVTFDKTAMTLKSQITAKSGSGQTRVSCLMKSVQISTTSPYYLFGQGLSANGGCTFVTGKNNTSTAAYSFVAGVGNTINSFGQNSAAIGQGLTVSSPNQFVIGMNNIPDSSYTYALIVGNDYLDSGTPSNALTLDWSGNLTVAGDVAGNGHTLSGKVNKSGDTMTGGLTNTADFTRKSTAITVGTSPASNTYISGLRFADSAGTLYANYGSVYYSNGVIASRIRTARTISGTTYENTLQLKIASDGTKTSEFNSQVVVDMASQNMLLKNTKVTSGRATALASNANAEEIWFRDSNDAGYASLRTYETTAEQTAIQLYVRNRANTSTTTWSNNQLSLLMKKDGTASVSVSAPAAWRSAIGVGSWTSGTLTLGNNLTRLGDPYYYYNGQTIVVHDCFRTTAAIAAGAVLETLTVTPVAKTNINMAAFNYSTSARVNAPVDTTANKTITATSAIASGVVIYIDLTIPRA